jgi:hypothetical protein
MPAQQFFISLNLTPCRTVRRLWPREQSLCALQHARGQAAFKLGRDPVLKIALNPYKLAILLQYCLFKNLLVQSGIGAIKGTLSNELRMRLIMDKNLKVLLSAVALAAFVAAPAVAKSRAQPHHTAPTQAHRSSTGVTGVRDT